MVHHKKRQHARNLEEYKDLYERSLRALQLNFLDGDILTFCKDAGRVYYIAIRTRGEQTEQFYDMLMEISVNPENFPTIDQKIEKDMELFLESLDVEDGETSQLGKAS